MKLHTIIAEGNLRLPPDIIEKVKEVYLKIKSACSPAYWKNNIAILNNIRYLPEPTHIVVQPKHNSKVYEVIVHIQYSTLSDLLREFSNTDGLILGQCDQYSRSITIRLPHITMDELSFLGQSILDLDDQNMIDTIKTAREMLETYFTPRLLILTVEHELIHAIDPTSIIDKPLPNRKRKPKIRAPYSDIYHSYEGHGTGKIPIEFNPHMHTLLVDLEELLNKYGKDEILPPLKEFIKSPNQIPKFIQTINKNFIRVSLKNPKIRKIFLSKLYNWISQND